MYPIHTRQSLANTLDSLEDPGGVFTGRYILCGGEFGMLQQIFNPVDYCIYWNSLQRWNQSWWKHDQFSGCHKLFRTNKNEKLTCIEWWLCNAVAQSMKVISSHSRPFKHTFKVSVVDLLQSQDSHVAGTMKVAAMLWQIMTKDKLTQKA